MQTRLSRSAANAGGLEPRPSVCADTPQLINAKTAAARCGMSVRTWLRHCDAGNAPWGIKLGGLRRWYITEIDAWIADGCPAIRSRKGVRR